MLRAWAGVRVSWIPRVLFQLLLNKIKGVVICDPWVVGRNNFPGRSNAGCVGWIRPHRIDVTFAHRVEN